MIKEFLNHPSIKPLEHYQNIHFINPFTKSFDIQHFNTMMDKHLLIKNHDDEDTTNLDFRFENFFRFQKFYYKLMVNKESGYLDALFKAKSDEKTEYINFIAIIQLLIKFNALFKLSREYTKSDFNNFIDNSSIFDNKFLSFHIDNFLFNTNFDKKTYEDKVNFKTSIFSMYGVDKAIYSAKALDALLSQAKVIFAEFKTILKNNKYDAYFDDFYSYYAELLGIDKKAMIYYLIDAGEEYSYITDILYRIWAISDEDDDE